MDFFAKTSTVKKTKTACAVVFAAGSTLSPSAKILDAELGGALKKVLSRGDLKDSPGASEWIPADLINSDLQCERVLLVQLGKNNKDSSVDNKTWSDISLAIAVALRSKPIKESSLFLDEIGVEQNMSGASDHKVPAKTLLAGEILATQVTRHGYRYTETKSQLKDEPKLKKVSLIADNAATVKSLKAGLAKGKSLGDGINLARELGNLPGNICTPSHLANQAKTLASQSTKLKVKILNEAQMKKLGMGSLLSVSAGSDEEAKLIVMEYKNGTGQPNVLVGKGITFDTGGISLKPGGGMDEMKFDMCGAASVFGTMQSLVSMDAKVNVVGIVAAAENMPSGGATKPGDVVTSMSGLTIEVLNTDAEGRLVLCDALTYAERFKPKSVVDIATLTGACVVALGQHATGLFSNDQKLADKLLDSGKTTGDKAWQMPIWDEYQKQLDSPFADIANIGGREAGSVTAACFLSRFTKKYPWAHLDIAGSAWFSGAKKGATGRPVGLLVDYLLRN